MQPLAVVEDLDVFGDGETCPGPGSKALPVVHLVLQGGEEGFGYGVVPAHPGPSQAPANAVLGGEGGELGRRVLGGFKRSSQHPDQQGCDVGTNSSVDVDEDRPRADAVPRPAAAAA